MQDRCAADVGREIMGQAMELLGSDSELARNGKATEAWAADALQLFRAINNTCRERGVFDWTFNRTDANNILVILQAREAAESDEDYEPSDDEIDVHDIRKRFRTQEGKASLEVSANSQLSQKEQGHGR
jgi:hypothetical protein